MSLAPIQTRQHWLRKCHLEVNDEAPEGAMSSTRMAIKHHPTEKEKFWMVTLSLAFAARSEEEHCRFTGEIIFEGFFEVHKDYPKAKTEDLVRMNGGAVLYGAIRELVIGLTARSEYGPMEIPTIDARVFMEKKEAKEEPSVASSSSE
jgi:preprotein translocase subunit SecB